MSIEIHGLPAQERRTISIDGRAVFDQLGKRDNPMHPRVILSRGYLDGDPADIINIARERSTTSTQLKITPSRKVGLSISGATLVMDNIAYMTLGIKEGEVDFYHLRSDYIGELTVRSDGRAVYSLYNVTGSRLVRAMRTSL